MSTMDDAVNVGAIPADARIVAGYVDGWYRTVAALRARFPNAYVVEITVTGLPGIRVCDCETGDLTPAEAAGWARRELAAGRRPTIYCNESTWGTVRLCLGAQANDVDWWVADYDGDPTIPAGAVAKQYQTGAFDVSNTVAGWPFAESPAGPILKGNNPVTVTESPINGDYVGIATTPSGKGYWLATADGGVMSHGDAVFHGSLGGVKLATPIVDIVATSTGGGYLLLAQGGGVFAFGDAKFEGVAAA